MAATRGAGWPHAALARDERRRRRGSDPAIPRPAARHLLLLATLLVHVVALLLIFPNTREDEVMSGFLRLTFHDSGATLVGAVPYRDFLLEYPPGSLYVMLLPRYFASGYLQYRSLFFLQVTALDCVIVLTLYASARAARLRPIRVLGLYTLGLALLGPLVDYRLDLAPAALTALAVLAWQRDRAVIAAILLAAGTATKVYPLLLLPPLLLDEWTRGRTRHAARALLAFAATLALLLSPAILAGAQSLLHSLSFQTNRHLQVESIWATIPLLLHLTIGFPLEVAGRDRALVILGPGDSWGAAGTPVLALVTLAIYGAWRRRLGQSAEARHAMILLGTAALILATATLSKVLSPQFLLWALPALVLLPLPSSGQARALAAIVLFLAALPLTQWVYPMHYGDLVRYLAPLEVTILALRNLLLALALLLLLSLLGRRVDMPAPEGAGSIDVSNRRSPRS